MSDARDQQEDRLRAWQRGFEAGMGDISELERARLRRARRELLAQRASSARPARKSPVAWLAPLATAAAIGLLAVLVMPYMTPESASPEPSATELAEAEGISDLEILLAGEDLDFYQELDFYIWLEAELAGEVSDAG